MRAAGGITESSIHVEDIGKRVEEFVRQFIEGYAVPTMVELWSDNADNGPPGKLGEFRFPVADHNGDILEIEGHHDPSRTTTPKNANGASSIAYRYTIACGRENQAPRTAAIPRTR